MKKIISFMFLLAGSAVLSSTVAFSSAPLVHSPQAGYFRTSLGAFEIIALSDGTVDLPMSKLLKNVTPGEYKKAASAAFLPENFETSVNGFLINTGTQLVLVDTGSGSLFGPTLGKLITNLKSAGYKPEQVDFILITHMHLDHVGGLTSDQKMNFPNATVYADQAESDFWLNEQNLAKADEAHKGFFQGAQSSLAPYKKAGKLKPIPAGGVIVPGITARATHGHTKGHTSYLVESEKSKLLITGDLIHMGAVQFGKPTAAIEFDTDSKEAVKQRIAMFSEASKSGYMIAASHISFPGLGHLRGNKKSFTFVPVVFNR